MIIPITFASESSTSSNPKLPSGLAKISHDELVLIELQGTLEIESSHPNGRNGNLVGTLKIDSATNKPTLLIGHHLLEGKIATLPKPLAVLHRSNTGRNTTSLDEDGETNVDASMEVDYGEVDYGDRKSPQAGWTVVGIVKKKILFSKRPTPVTLKK